MLLDYQSFKLIFLIEILICPDHVFPREWKDCLRTVSERCSCFVAACGRNCTNCTMDGVCTECEGDLKLFAPPGSNFTKCVKKCPLFHKLDKGSSPARCEAKQGNKSAKTSKWLCQIDLGTSISRHQSCRDDIKLCASDVDDILNCPLGFKLGYLQKILNEADSH